MIPSSRGVWSSMALAMQIGVGIAFAGLIVLGWVIGWFVHTHL